MPNEPLARAIAAISDIFSTMRRADGNLPHWFVSFGALLYFVRDFKLGREFNQDIDISLLFGDVDRESLIGKFNEAGYDLHHELLDSHNHQPLQMAFRPNGSVDLGPYDVDLFFWVVGKQYAWHTYDASGQNRKTLDQYLFKGTPKPYIMGETIPYTWEEIAPPLQLPVLYGSLLDTWYPPKRDATGVPIGSTGWLCPDRQYGQSDAPIRYDVADCRELMGQMP